MHAILALARSAKAGPAAPDDRARPPAASQISDGRRLRRDALPRAEGGGPAGRAELRGGGQPALRPRRPGAGRDLDRGRQPPRRAGARRARRRDRHDQRLEAANVTIGQPSAGASGERAGPRSPTDPPRPSVPRGKQRSIRDDLGLAPVGEGRQVAAGADLAVGRAGDDEHLTNRRRRTATGRLLLPTAAEKLLHLGTFGHNQNVSLSVWSTSTGWGSLVEPSDAHHPKAR